MFKEFLWVLLFWTTSVYCIFENCDYYQKLEFNKTYSIFSPGYPNKYPPGSNCRWIAQSPPDTKIILSCSQFSIPVSRNCKLNKFGISKGGRIDLEDVEFYCGQGTFNVSSTSNKLNLVLLSSYSAGGRFFCNLVVKGVRLSPGKCTCGHKNTMRIVGGTETGINEYPMMAGLVDGIKQELFCGATIISKSYALTAAHCLMQVQPRKIGLLVGDHDISVGNDTDSARLYLIVLFIIHPNYDTSNQRNDIAIVKVKDKIFFDMKVGPACLPFKNKNYSFVGETVYALGWGSTSFGGAVSGKLLHVPLNVVTFQECKSVYGSLITEQQICVFRDNKDACQSDSGGPLLWTDPATKTLSILGIISYGIQCATPNPSVNTRVSSYLDWIESSTGENFCRM